VENLNVLPMRVYKMLSSMYWLYSHRIKVHYFEKSIKCLDDHGEGKILQGRLNPTSVRFFTTMQAKGSNMK